jgi:Flp pilus assembly protein TadB
VTLDALLAGAGIGFGLWLVVIGLRPRPQPLAKALAALNPPPVEVLPEGTELGWTARLGRPGVRLLARTGLPTARTRRDLATLGKPVSVHLAEQVGASLVGLLAPPVFALLLALGGVGLGVEVPAGASLLMAGIGFIAPELSARSEAGKHRAGFQHALSSFLDLVVVAVAGGAGVDQALDDAASVGRGPAYDELRYALTEARDAHLPPWNTLAQLGARVGVDELQQLAATVGLAGTEGARVRTSLRSRAAALRTRQLTDAEGEANAATERMNLPMVALLAGFLIFIGYPAISAVLTGL